jgi:hypothetical protein
MGENQISTNEKEEIRLNNQAGLDVSKVLPFEDFKKSLGRAADKYNDEQIETMRVTCDRIADLAFDAWLNGRNAA